MTTKAQDIDSVVSTLQSKLADNKAAVTNHQQAIQYLLAEASAIEVTLKTLQSFGVTAGTPQSGSPSQSHQADQKTRTLPVTEMIFEILGKAYKDGATPTQVMESMELLYDANPNPNTVGPTLWRLEKEGRLAKRNNLYLLPQNLNRSLSSPDTFAGQGELEVTKPEAQGREAGPGGGTR